MSLSEVLIRDGNDLRPWRGVRGIEFAPPDDVSNSRHLDGVRLPVRGRVGPLEGSIESYTVPDFLLENEKGVVTDNARRSRSTYGSKLRGSRKLNTTSCTTS